MFNCKYRTLTHLGKSKYNDRNRYKALVSMITIMLDTGWFRLDSYNLKSFQGKIKGISLKKMCIDIYISGSYGSC